MMKLTQKEKRRIKMFRRMDQKERDIITTLLKYIQDNEDIWDIVDDPDDCEIFESMVKCLQCIKIGADKDLNSFSIIETVYEEDMRFLMEM